MTETHREPPAPLPAPPPPPEPPEPSLARLADALRRLPPSCGPVRLVAVDGHAGSGKSTFAGRLAAALGGAPVLHLDDIASHAALFDWTERLRHQVLDPLSRGEAAHYAAYNWTARRYGPANRPLPPAPVVLLEGVGAGRRALRPFLAALLWMDLPRADSWARGRRRDGPAQRDFWDGWEAAEQRHFAADPSRPAARLLVREVSEGHSEGYEVLAGPAGTAAEAQIITEGEGRSAAR
ncbi:uridine kinase family protein [Streptomyces sp. G45]|uniref:uridine kinase family protein n=1 Tax=Streptomyces sp. G45 TaxID=3406627 RepID=UPI003C1CA179